MAKFFRISGVIFFLGTVIGACLLFSSSGSGSLADAIIGIGTAFVSTALGLLFIYTAELLDRISALEKSKEDKKTSNETPSSP